MDLDDGLASRRGEMVRLCRGCDKATRRECLRLAVVDRIAHPDQEDTRDHGHMLVRGMVVRLDDLAVGKFEANRVDPRLTGIALEYGETGASGKERRSGSPR